MLGEAGGKEASLRWRSIHKNYFYLLFHEKTTEDKAGRQWGGGERGDKGEEPSRDLRRAGRGWGLFVQEQDLGGDNRAVRGRAETNAGLSFHTREGWGGSPGGGAGHPKGHGRGM